MKDQKATIIVHSGEHDKIYSALIIASGALAMGMETTLFFTFWGLERLKKNGIARGKLSNMNFLGIGKYIMSRKMRKSNVIPLEKLMKEFRELGGRIVACDMTMDIMGVDKDNMDMNVIDEFGSVGTYLKYATESQLNLIV